MPTGDSKEARRRGSRALFRAICCAVRWGCALHRGPGRVSGGHAPRCRAASSQGAVSFANFHKGVLGPAADLLWSGIFSGGDRRSACGVGGSASTVTFAELLSRRVARKMVTSDSQLRSSFRTHLLRDPGQVRVLLGVSVSSFIPQPRCHPLPGHSWGSVE